MSEAEDPFARSDPLGANRRRRPTAYSRSGQYDSRIGGSTGRGTIVTDENSVDMMAAPDGVIITIHQMDHLVEIGRLAAARFMATSLRRDLPAMGWPR